MKWTNLHQGVNLRQKKLWDLLLIQSNSFSDLKLRQDYDLRKRTPV
jgi:hypothetical protein